MSKRCICPDVCFDDVVSKTLGALYLHTAPKELYFLFHNMQSLRIIRAPPPIEERRIYSSLFEAKETCHRRFSSIIQSYHHQQKPSTRHSYTTVERRPQQVKVSRGFPHVRTRHPYSRRGDRIDRFRPSTEPQSNYRVVKGTLNRSHPCKKSAIGTEYTIYRPPTITLQPNPIRKSRTDVDGEPPYTLIIMLFREGISLSIEFISKKTFCTGELSICSSSSRLREVRSNTSASKVTRLEQCSFRILSLCTLDSWSLVPCEVSVAGKFMMICATKPAFVGPIESTNDCKRLKRLCMVSISASLNLLLPYNALHASTDMSRLTNTGESHA